MTSNDKAKIICCAIIFMSISAWIGMVVGLESERLRALEICPSPLEPGDYYTPEEADQ